MNEKMTMDEFKEAVRDNIKDYLPQKYEDAEVKFMETLKNNDTRRCGLQLATCESNVTPLIYMEPFYEDYLNGTPIDEVIGDMADLRIENEADEPVNLAFHFDFDNIRDSLRAVLVNRDANEQLLSQRPHTDMGELSVYYQAVVSEKGYGRASIPISNEIFKHMGTDMETLHETAMKNMSEKEYFMLIPMEDIMEEIGVPTPENDIGMYVLTNQNRILGAVGILDDNVMAQVAEELGGDFYVLPSSIHETILIPKDEDMDIEGLADIIKEVNRTMVLPEEYLSDHLYEYDSKEHELFRSDQEQEHRLSVAQRHSKDKDRERMSVRQKLPELKNKAEKHVMEAGQSVMKNAEPALTM